MQGNPCKKSGCKEIFLAKAKCKEILAKATKCKEILAKATKCKEILAKANAEDNSTEMKAKNTRAKV